MRIEEFLKREVLVTDGAMGTYYSSKYGEQEDIAEWANLKHKDRIAKIHREYLYAGARLLRTNTFALNSSVMGVTLQEQRKLIKAGYQIAKEEVMKYTKESGRECFVAADIGMIPMHGESTWEDIKEEYTTIVDAFLEEGATIFWFETFSSFRNIKEVCRYIKERNSEAEILVNFCINKNGYTSEGVSASTLLHEIRNAKEVTAGGFNCGIGSGHMYHVLSSLSFTLDKPIVVLPNAGYPEQLQNRLVFRKNIDYFVQNMNQIRKLGIQILGGCCGTTPSYINELEMYMHEGQKKGYTSEGKSELDKSITVKEQGHKEQSSNQEKEEKKEKKESAFYKKLMRGEKVIAVELDPPFDADDRTFLECARELKKSKADVVTIADSPMGRSRVDSILMSIKLMKECDVNVMPHVCCRDKNLIAMRSSLLGGYVNGIRDLLVVTGDPVPSEQRMMTTSVFDYNSIRLMQFIQQMNEEHMKERPICYGGALNPMLGNIEKVIERLKQKVDVGASYFLTQPVYTKDGMERLAYIKSKVDTKILGGIMPFVSYRNANFIKNEFIGIQVPEEILNRYHNDMTKEEAEDVGAQLATDLMGQLKDIVDGYYFMLPFNRVSLFKKIKDND